MNKSVFKYAEDNNINFLIIHSSEDDFGEESVCYRTVLTIKDDYPPELLMYIIMNHMFTSQAETLCYYFFEYIENDIDRIDIYNPCDEIFYFDRQGNDDNFGVKYFINNNLFGFTRSVQCTMPNLLRKIYDIIPSQYKYNENIVMSHEIDKVLGFVNNNLSNEKESYLEYVNAFSKDNIYDANIMKDLLNPNHAYPKEICDFIDSIECIYDFDNYYEQIVGDIDVYLHIWVNGNPEYRDVEHSTFNLKNQSWDKISCECIKLLNIDSSTDYNDYAYNSKYIYYYCESCNNSKYLLGDALNMHCYCGDYSHFLAFSTKNAAKKVFDLLPQKCKYIYHIPNLQTICTKYIRFQFNKNEIKKIDKYYISKYNLLDETHLN